MPATWGFPDVLINRIEIARPGMVWQVDGTSLNVMLDGDPKTSHYLLAGVDPATNMLIFVKVFYSGTTNKSFNSKALIKVLDQATKQKGIKQKLLIHTDREPQFCSKEYFK